MRRVWRCTVRMLGAAGVAAALGLTLYLWGWPVAARFAVDKLLRASGVEQYAFDLRSADVGGLHLSDVSIGPDRRLRASSVEITHTLSDLWNRRIRTARVVGARWEIRLGKDGVDLGPVDRFLGGDGKPRDRLPVDRVELRSSLLVCHALGRTWRVPVEGSLENEPESDTLQLDLRFRLLGRRLRLSGDVRRDGPLTATLALFAPSDGEASPEQRDPAIRLRYSDATLDADVGFTADRLDLALLGHEIEGHGVRVDGHATLDGRRRFGPTDLRVSLSRLSVDGRRFEKVRLRLARPADTASTGDADGDARRLAPPKADQGDGLHASLTAHDAEGRRVSLTARLPRDVVARAGLPPAVPFHLEAEGTLPEPVVTKLGRRGVAVSAERAAHLETRGTLHLPDRGSDAGRDDAPPWRLTWTDGRVTWPVSEVALTGTALWLEDGRAVIRTEGSVRPDRFRVDLLPETSVRLGAVRWGDTTTLFAEKGRATLTVQQPEATIHGRFDGTTLDWKATLPAAELEASGGLDSEAGLRADRIEATARISVAAAPGETNVNLLSAEPVKVEGLEGKGVKIPSVRLTWAGGDRPLFERHRTEEGDRRVRVAAALESEEPIRIEGANATAAVAAARVGTTLRWDGEERTGRLSLSADRVSVDSADLHLSGLSAELPLADGPADPGALTVEQVRWQETDLPPLRGTLDGKPTDLRLSATWPLGEEAALELSGQATLGDGGLSADLQADLSGFRLSRGTPLEAALASRVGCHLTGAVDAHAEVGYRDGRLRSSLTVSVDDGTLSANEDKHRVTGLQARLRFDRLFPPATKPTQRIRWEEAHLGELTFRNGMAELTLRDGAVFVERLRTDFAGGTLRAHAFRLTPSRTSIETDLFIEDVGLGRWLSLVSMERVTGEGQLVGRLQLRIRTAPTFAVQPGSGFLYARGTGTLAVADPAAATKFLAGKTPLAGSLDLRGEVRQRLIEALSDFRFTALRFTFTRSDEDLLMRVYTEGRGRKGARQAVEGLTINVRNADDLLNLALLVKLGLRRASASAYKRLQNQLRGK